MPESHERFTSLIVLDAMIISFDSQRGSGSPPRASSMYSPGGTMNVNIPSAPVSPETKGAPSLFFVNTRTVVWSGRSSHPGCGGYVSTGHTGPTETFPRTPDLNGSIPAPC